MRSSRSPAAAACKGRQEGESKSHFSLFSLPGGWMVLVATGNNHSSPRSPPPPRREGFNPMQRSPAGALAARPRIPTVISVISVLAISFLPPFPQARIFRRKFHSGVRSEPDRKPAWWRWLPRRQRRRAKQPHFHFFLRGRVSAAPRSLRPPRGSKHAYNSSQRGHEPSRPPPTLLGRLLPARYYSTVVAAAAAAANSL